MDQSILDAAKFHVPKKSVVNSLLGYAFLAGFNSSDFFLKFFNKIHIFLYLRDKTFYKVDLMCSFSKNKSIFTRIIACFCGNWFCLLFSFSLLIYKCQNLQASVGIFLNITYFSTQ